MAYRLTPAESRQSNAAHHLIPSHRKHFRNKPLIEYPVLTREEADENLRSYGCDSSFISSAAAAADDDNDRLPSILDAKAEDDYDHPSIQLTRDNQRRFTRYNPRHATRDNQRRATRGFVKKPSSSTEIDIELGPHVQKFVDIPLQRFDICLTFVNAYPEVLRADYHVFLRHAQLMYENQQHDAGDRFIERLLILRHCQKENLSFEEALVFLDKMNRSAGRRLELQTDFKRLSEGSKSRASEHDREYLHRQTTRLSVYSSVNGDTTVTNTTSGVITPAEPPSDRTFDHPRKSVDSGFDGPSTGPTIGQVATTDKLCTTSTSSAGESSDSFDDEFPHSHLPPRLIAHIEEFAEKELIPNLLQTFISGDKNLLDCQSFERQCAITHQGRDVDGTSEAHQDADVSGAGEASSCQGLDSTGAGQKKRRRRPDDIDGFEGDGDGEGDGEDDRSSSSRNSDFSGGAVFSRLLACLFHKRNPEKFCEGSEHNKKYKTCPSGFRSFNRLRQHLRQVHKGPQSFCNTCSAVFLTDKDAESHARNAALMPCEYRKDPRFEAEFVMGERLGLVNGHRKSTSVSDEDAWFLYWDKFFPDDVRPSSPLQNLGPFEAQFQKASSLALPLMKKFVSGRIPAEHQETVEEGWRYGLQYLMERMLQELAKPSNSAAVRLLNAAPSNSAAVRPLNAAPSNSATVRLLNAAPSEAQQLTSLLSQAEQYPSILPAPPRSTVAVDPTLILHEEEKSTGLDLTAHHDWQPLYNPISDAAPIDGTVATNDWLTLVNPEIGLGWEPHPSYPQSGTYLQNETHAHGPATYGAGGRVAEPGGMNTHLNAFNPY